MATGLTTALDSFREDLSPDQLVQFDELVSTDDTTSIAAFVQRLDAPKTGVPRRCWGARLSPILEKLQQLLTLGAPLAGIDPNAIAPTVLGIVKMVLQFAIDYAKFYERLTEMLMKWGRKIPSLNIYRDVYASSPELQKCLIDIEVTFVVFCHTTLRSLNLSAKHGRTVNHLKNAADKLFNGFDATYGPIEKRFNDLIDVLNSDIEMANNRVNYVERQRNQSERRQQSAFRIMWHRDNPKTTELTTEIRDKQTLGEAIKQRESDEQLLNRLSNYPYQDTFRQQRKTALGSAGRWIEGKQEYQDWLAADVGMLLLSGNLGAGKSVLCAKVISDLQAMTKPQRLLYFFATPSAARSLEVEVIVGSLAKQCLSPDQLPAAVRSRLQSMFDGAKTVDSVELGSLLSFLILQDDRLDRPTVLIIDGLDQMMAKGVQELLDVLRKLCKLCKTKIKLLLVGRDEIDHQIRTRLGHDDLPSIQMESKLVQQDIGDYVSYYVQEHIASAELCERAPDLPDLIRSSITQKANGMFLLAVLQLEELRSLRTIAEQREALPHLPRSLSEMFVLILKRIEKAGDATFVAKIMQIVYAAVRPLSLEELRDALAVEEGQKSYNREALITDIYSMMPPCRSLIVWDRDDDQVRFSHDSVRSFLSSPTSVLANDLELFRIDRISALAEFGVLVVTYLSYSDFQRQVATIPAKSNMLEVQNPMAMATLSLGNNFGSGHGSSLVGKLVRVSSRMRTKLPFDLGSNSTAGTPVKLESYPLLDYCKQNVMSASKYLTLAKSVSENRRNLTTDGFDPVWQAFEDIIRWNIHDLDVVHTWQPDLHLHLAHFELACTTAVVYTDVKTVYDRLTDLFSWEPETMIRAMPQIYANLMKMRAGEMLPLFIYTAIPFMSDHSPFRKDCFLEAVRLTQRWRQELSSAGPIKVVSNSTVIPIDKRVFISSGHQKYGILSPYGQTASQIAAIRSSIEIVKVMAADGCPIGAVRDLDGRPLLQIFAARSYADGIRWLIQDKSSELDALSKYILAAALHLSADSIDILSKLQQAEQPSAFALLIHALSVDLSDADDATGIPILISDPIDEVVMTWGLLLPRRQPARIDIRQTQVDMVEFLLHRGAPLYMNDQEGRTSLHLAVLTGNHKLIAYMTRLICDGELGGQEFFERRNKRGYTALELALYSRSSAEIVFCLIDAGASVVFPDSMLEDVLHVVLGQEAGAVDYPLFERLVKRCPQLLVSRVSYAQLILNRAVEGNHYDAIPSLAKAGIDLNQCWGNPRVPPLQHALALNNPLPMLMRLVSSGADINLPGKLPDGSTSSILRLAVQDRNLAVLEWLLAHGANVHGVPDEEFTPMEWIFLHTWEEDMINPLVKLLLPYSPRPLVKWGDNMVSALAAAILRGAFDTGKVLCRAGIGLSDQDFISDPQGFGIKLFSDRLSEVLVTSECNELLKLVIETKGFDVDRKFGANPDGQGGITLLRQACAVNEPGAVEILLDAGAYEPLARYDTTTQTVHSGLFVDLLERAAGMERVVRDQCRLILWVFKVSGAEFFDPVKGSEARSLLGIVDSSVDRAVSIHKFKKRFKTSAPDNVIDQLDQLGTAAKSLHRLVVCQGPHVSSEMWIPESSTEFGDGGKIWTIYPVVIDLLSPAIRSTIVRGRYGQESMRALLDALGPSSIHKRSWGETIGERLGEVERRLKSREMDIPRWLSRHMRGIEGPMLGIDGPMLGIDGPMLGIDGPILRPQ